MISFDENKNKAVGVFDSGVGGMTVLRELLSQCPNERFVYIGDDINSPYGEKNTEEIQQLSLNVINKPEFNDVKALVIACNTITAAAYDIIVQNTSVPVIGVVESGAKAALDATKNNKVGILATNATVNSGVYDKTLLNFNPDVDVTSVGAPKLHAMVENHLDRIVNNPDKEIYNLVESHIKPFIDANCDTVVLACTHFPPYRNLVSKIAGPQLNVVDPSYNTAKKLKTTLEQNDMQNEGPGSFEIISTAGNDEKYKEFSKLILG